MNKMQEGVLLGTFMLSPVVPVLMTQLGPPLAGDQVCLLVVPAGGSHFKELFELVGESGRTISVRWVLRNRPAFFPFNIHSMGGGG